MKKFIFSTLAVLALSSAQAHAKFVEIDYMWEDDKYLTVDTISGLDWMDPNLPSERSPQFSDIISGDQFSGYRLPSIVDLTSLMNNLTGRNVSQYVDFSIDSDPSLSAFDETVGGGVTTLTSTQLGLDGAEMATIFDNFNKLSGWANWYLDDSDVGNEKYKADFRVGGTYIHNASVGVFNSWLTVSYENEGGSFKGGEFKVDLDFYGADSYNDVMDEYVSTLVRNTSYVSTEEPETGGGDIGDEIMAGEQGVSDVSAPIHLSMLGMGLLGFGLSRKRRSKK